MRLPWSCAPELVLAALEDEHCLCCLTGIWAGGGTIIASEPLRVADPRSDPFALLDDLPQVTADAGQAAGAVGGGWFGWLGYRLATRVEQVPLADARPVPLPDFHLAYYDHVLHRDAYGFWWFEALATPERRAELEERLEYLRRRIADQRFREATPEPPPPAPLRLAPEVADHHLRAVAECRERIAAGEIFQANICLRLEAEYDGPATALVRGALVSGRVPQYTAAFNTPEGGVVSLSPELFLRRKGRQVRSGPDQGHRPSAQRSGPGGAVVGAAAGVGQGRGRARDDRRPDAQRHRSRL